MTEQTTNKLKREYFALDLEKFKENPEENLLIVLEALELTFSNNSINFDKLMPLLKMNNPITYD